MQCTDTAFPKAGHELRPFSGLFRLAVEKSLEKVKEVGGGGGGPLVTYREAHGQSPCDPQGGSWAEPNWDEHGVPVVISITSPNTELQVHML